MKRTVSGRPWMAAIAVLSVVCFAAFSICAASPLFAADEWETWPAKPADSGPDAATTTGAAKAGGSAGGSVWAGLSTGTIGWIAAGTAAIIGIAIAAGGGGGGSTTTSHH